MSSSLTIHRHALYDQIWSPPCSRLARQYGISDVALKKVCRKMGIPTPGRGYWAKQQHGHTPPRTPLPPPTNNQPLTHTFSKRLLRRQEPTDAPPGPTLPPTLVLPTEAGVSLRSGGTKHLRRPHPLVRATRDALKRRSKSRWPTDRYGKTSPNEPGTLDVWVYPERVPRALRILNTFIKAAERNGCTIQRKGLSRNYTTHLVVDDESIRFRLVEKARQHQKKSSRTDPAHTYTPSGVLTFSFEDTYAYHGKKTWKDAKRPLEDQLLDILTAAFHIAHAQKRLRQRRQDAERGRAHLEALREDQARQEANEHARRQHLEAQADAWVRSQTLHAYLDEVERQADQQPRTPEAQQHYTQWLTWARTHAHRLDPLHASLPFPPDQLG